MNFNKKTILYGIGILISLLIVYLIVFYEEEDIAFNKIEFTDGNKILNRELPKYMDTIVLAGLNELDVKNTIVIIKPIKIKKSGEVDLDAYIVQQSSNVFAIYIENSSKYKSFNIMAHELIHLKQYTTNRLRIERDSLVWNDRSYYKSNMPKYDERPWEIEAFEISPNLKNKMKTILYEKE